MAAGAVGGVRWQLRSFCFCFVPVDVPGSSAVPCNDGLPLWWPSNTGQVSQACRRAGHAGRAGRSWLALQAVERWRALKA